MTINNMIVGLHVAKEETCQKAVSQAVAVQIFPQPLLEL